MVLFKKEIKLFHNYFHSKEHRIIPLQHVPPCKITYYFRAAKYHGVSGVGETERRRNVN